MTTRFTAVLAATVLALVLVAGASASTVLNPVYRTDPWSGQRVMVAPAVVREPVRVVAYAPYGLSASYLAHLWGPSTRVAYTDDKYATSYSSRVSDGMGNTYVEGFYAPKPYRWECAGNGCARTQYLSGLRVDALHPDPSVTYTYTMTRTW
jgi:hypothetical protein